jgi:hypothetical protein
LDTAAIHLFSKIRYHQCGRLPSMVTQRRTDCETGHVADTFVHNADLSKGTTEALTQSHVRTLQRLGIFTLDSYELAADKM